MSVWVEPRIREVKMSTPFVELCRGFPSHSQTDIAEQPQYARYRTMFHEAFVRKRWSTFTDFNQQALDLALSLISFILGCPNCPLDVTIGIVLVGLKFIAINVCVIVPVCNRDIKKRSAIERTRFESIRKVFKELSWSPISVSFLIVEAIALLLQFGVRCIYYPDSTEYCFLLNFIELNETTHPFSSTSRRSSSRQC
jgi:hypothetical protein